MPVPPDIGYFLDCSHGCIHIASDTYDFQHRSGRATKIIDEFDSREQQYSSHMFRLQDIGFALEHDYLSWRKDATLHERRISTLGYLKGIDFQLTEFLGTHSNVLGEFGAKSLTKTAIAKCDEKFGFYETLGVMKRYLNRVLVDAKDLSQSDLVHYQAIRSNLAFQAMQDEFQIQTNLTKGTKEAKKFLEEQKKKDRGIIKRSIKIAEKLLGYETTKIFINGHKIRFEGKYAFYELRKTSPIQKMGHGSSVLSLFDKKHDIHICDVCIYTPDVPALDHVASIAMHIKTGNEEKLLEIGNPYNIKSRPKWLQPYLPEKKEVTIEGWRLPKPPEPALRKELLRYVYDHLGVQYQQFKSLERKATTYLP